MAQVVGEDACLEAVAAGVDARDSFVEARDGLDHNHRAEDLIADHGLVIRDIGEDRWAEKGTVALAP